MAATAEIARLRAKEREVARKAKALGWSMKTSLRFRYFIASHPRRTICIRTKVQA